jgi:hypothetical protein
MATWKAIGTKVLALHKGELSYHQQTSYRGIASMDVNFLILFGGKASWGLETQSNMGLSEN